MGSLRGAASVQSRAIALAVREHDRRLIATFKTKRYPLHERQGGIAFQPSFNEYALVIM
jgi:hypothetical protein